METISEAEDTGLEFARAVGARIEGEAYPMYKHSQAWGAAVAEELIARLPADGMPKADISRAYEWPYVGLGKKWIDWGISLARKDPRVMVIYEKRLDSAGHLREQCVLYLRRRRSGQ
ncbi:MAG: hypothetical protein ACLPKI_22810 [Streptosporangiaceae bacterium]